MDTVQRAELFDPMGSGLTPQDEGWFIVNVADSLSVDGPQGGVIPFDNHHVQFPAFGINIRVLQPGQPACKYHRENQQEAFLVLDGECTAVIEGEEHPLKQWDFVHCPAGTTHVFVGAGERPCAILMVGERKGEDAEELEYPVDAAAARHGASVAAFTTSGDEAYADVADSEPAPLSWPPHRQPD